MFSPQPKRVHQSTSPAQALIRALRSNNTQECDKLLEFSAEELSVRDEEGNTSLQCAIELRQDRIALNLVKKGVDVKSKCGPQNLAPYEYACGPGIKGIMEDVQLAILDAGYETCHADLIRALKDCRPKLAQKIIELLPTELLSVEDASGKTALQYAETFELDDIYLLLLSNQNLLPNFSFTDTTQKFYVVQSLGSGAYGQVDKARSKLEPSLYVALKRTRFGYNQFHKLLAACEEIKMLSKLHHSNIVAYFSASAECKEICITMEYIDGKRLSALNDWRFKCTDLERRLIVINCILQQILAALAHLEDMGIIHKDLKPQNVMIIGLDEASIVKVIDFGISILAGTKNKDQLSTRGYTPPEAYREEPEFLQCNYDVFSYGVMAFELLSDKELFNCTRHSDREKHTHELVKYNTLNLQHQWPDELRADKFLSFRTHVDKALEKDPLVRPSAKSLPKITHLVYKCT